MSENWKPGDVGLSVRHGYRGIFVESCRVPQHDRNGDACWHNESGFADPATDHRRRLAVIDPEDREQVDRLAKAMHESDHLALWHDLHNETRSQIEDAMQAALREFANPTPPKPEEPTGLGAVVEAIYDNRFVRVGSAGWVHEDDRGGNPCDWQDIAVVRVLDEGWSA